MSKAVAPSPPIPVVEAELVAKYNRPGPRYTSYPTALQFRDDLPPGELLAEATRDQGPLSLYFHLPFCNSLCWFCGCNKVITADRGRADLYLDALERELDLFPAAEGGEREVVQLHFGGGTPNFLTVPQIERLGRLIRSRFRLADGAECGVELDPRFLDLEQVRAFRGIGMQRASFGVQDVNPAVQKAVHRLQPEELNEQAFAWLRSEGFESINVDLIYGLPGQTVESYAETLDRVLAYEPDRLAVFSYAHVPWVSPAQKILERHVLPDAATKIGLLKLVIETLTGAGYVFIGMDHFAKPGDELVLAQQQGTLQRNFQGYSTRGGVEIRGFGVSSISQTRRSYRQNTKTLESWHRALAGGNLPVERGLILTPEDELRRHVIMRLMCDFRLDYRAVGEAWGLDFSRHFARALESLAEMEDDGLVLRREDSLEVTPQGRLFIRNAAMAFDAYLQQGEGRHSRTV